MNRTYKKIAQTLRHWSAHRATASNVVNRLLVSAPFLGMVVIGLDARNQPNNFEFVSTPPALAKSIEAYVPYIKDVDKNLRLDQSSSETATCRVAEYWLSGVRAAKIGQISYPDFSDLSSVGVRHEIVTAGDLIAQTLNCRATDAIRAHRWESAARDALLAANVVKSTEFFDLYSLGVYSATQRISLARIKHTWPHLSRSTKSLVKHEASSFLISRSVLEPMALTERLNAIVYEDTESPDGLSMQDAEADLPLQRIADVKNVERFSSWVKHQRDACRTDAGTAACGMFYLGFRAAERNNQWVEDILNS